MEGSGKPLAHPFTFGGVAACARMPFWRLAAMSVALAAVLSGIIWDAVSIAWAPPLRQAIPMLPSQARLENGALFWPEDAAPLLSEGPFLSLAVNPKESPLAQTADLQLEFRRTHAVFRSIFGEFNLPYPANSSVGLGRAEVEPWWGAWQPLMKGAVFGGSFLFLQLSWVALATMLTVPVRLLSLSLGRDAALWGCWKLSHAALFPGAMLMGLAILLYAHLRLSLTGALILLPGHVIVGVIYALGATLALPYRAGAEPTGPNPFVPALTPDKPGAPSQNPFAEPPKPVEEPAPSPKASKSREANPFKPR